MALVPLFKSSMPSMSFAFKDGMVGHFLNGRFVCEIKKYAEELMEEVGNIGVGKSRHPHIYVDADEHSIDTEALSPIEQVKKDAYEKAKADIIAAMNRGESFSEAGNFAASMNNSNKIAEAADSMSGSPTNVSAADLIAAARAGKLPAPAVSTTPVVVSTPAAPQ